MGGERHGYINKLYERSYPFEDLMLLGKCIFAGFFTLFNWVWISLFFMVFADRKCNSWFNLTFSFIQLLTLSMVRHDSSVASFNFEKIPDHYLHICTLFGGGPVAAFAIIFFKHRDGDKEYQRTFITACFYSVLTILLYGFFLCTSTHGFNETISRFKSDFVPNMKQWMHPGK